MCHVFASSGPVCIRIPSIDPLFFASVIQVDSVRVTDANLATDAVIYYFLFEHTWIVSLAVLSPVLSHADIVFECPSFFRCACGNQAVWISHAVISIVQDIESFLAAFTNRNVLNNAFESWTSSWIQLPSIFHARWLSYDPFVSVVTEFEKRVVNVFGCDGLITTLSGRVALFFKKQTKFIVCRLVTLIAVIESVDLGINFTSE